MKGSYIACGGWPPVIFQVHPDTLMDITPFESHMTPRKLIQMILLPIYVLSCDTKKLHYLELGLGRVSAVIPASIFSHSALRCSEELEHRSRLYSPMKNPV